MAVPYDTILQNGLHFDGTGAPGVIRRLGIRDGRVVAVSDAPLAHGDCPRVIDARGKWVMPGFIDLHTHYDAELLAAPSLSESIRHGVTTVAVGSCSISAVLSEPEDCSDLFTRVESVPRAHVLPLLRETKTWTSPAGYVDFLRHHPLGANIISFLGHSDLRTRVMGLERSVDGKARPTEAELQEMERHLEDALDQGFLGLSTMTNPWDKLDGDRFRSAQLPSTYATWGEYRRLHGVLRRRGGIPFAEHAQPPAEVTPAIAARRPVVRPNREIDCFAGSHKFIRNLRARRPRAHHKHGAFGQLVRIAVGGGMNLHDPGAPGNESGNDGLLESPGGGNYKIGFNGTLRCLDPEARATIILPHRFDPDAAADGSPDFFGIGHESIRDLFLGHEGVRIVAGKFQARIAIVPGGTIGNETVPALRAPAFGDPAPFKNEVRHAALT